jgi:uncharacterized membrane protein YccC
MRMVNASYQVGQAPNDSAAGRWGPAWVDAATAAGPPLLYALRLWASVCLALYIAFWLELDNPFWAGTSAAIVCQPQLGASLRKGWFRMIGTVVGAAMIVVLTSLFPQDRIGFLVLLALWGGICAFAATVLHDFASYSAALAGYTAAIIAADTLGATGGASPDVFMLAVWRASEICIGIVCAGVVLAGTDFGGAQRRLAASLAGLATEIVDGLSRTLARAGRQLTETQAERRELVRRVVALDPIVDQALGESSQVRYHSPTLQAVVYGLFKALGGWRSVATHLAHLPVDVAKEGAETVLRRIPPEFQSARKPGSASHWMSDPIALRRVCQEAVRTLLALPAGTPSLRLLVDETTKVLSGVLHVLDGLALLVDAADQPVPDYRGFRLTVPDWAPALVNAARAFVAVGAVEFFWVVTAWPNGASAVVFAAIVILLLSPRGDLAYGGAIAFGLGVAVGVPCAAIIKFAVLPGLATFPAFCAAIGLFLVPAGFALAMSHQPALVAVFSAMTFNFVPLLAPTNEMSYDTQQFYNSALAIFVGCTVAPLAFLLLPPLSPAQRTRRLLALTLRDLRRLAVAPRRLTWEGWDARMIGRLTALPDQAEPLQRARLLAALSVGAEIIQLSRMSPRLGAAELEAALKAVTSGNTTTAIAKLREFDNRLASSPDAKPETAVALRARGRLLVISEALTEHSSYFDMGALA